jgi:uncharacterized protein
MANLCDINVLLAACYDRHVHHPAALAWLNEQDVQEAILCRSTQMGLLRLLCNPAVMDLDVCSMVQAWDIYDSLSKDERFTFYAEPDGLNSIFRQYTQSGRPSPKLWQDAYLAAFARAGGLGLVTFDGGFRQFDGVKVTLLGD